MPDSTPVPSAEEVNAYFERCSNWGRWGEGDNAGTINTLTPVEALMKLNEIKKLIGKK